MGVHLIKPTSCCSKVSFRELSITCLLPMSLLEAKPRDQMSGIIQLRIHFASSSRWPTKPAGWLADSQLAMVRLHEAAPEKERRELPEEEQEGSVTRVNPFPSLLAKSQSRPHSMGRVFDL